MIVVLTRGIVHEVPDPETPETWRWMFRLTLNDKGSNLSMDAEETRKLWEENSSILAEPFRAAFLAVPERAPLWADRVCHWPTVAWNDRYVSFFPFRCQNQKSVEPLDSLRNRGSACSWTYIFVAMHRSSHLLPCSYC